MVNLVPNFVREIWDIWNIRGLVLTSFALQVCLLLFAPLRKCTNKSIVTWFLWSAYLSADYVATFCIGLIFDKRDSFSANSAGSYIYVFWTTFLLLHLGGPDSITAFALEDNELWLRHLLGLVFQVAATVFVFFLTIPGNTLWIPTTLVFIAAMIKYIERTRSLFLASKNTLKKFCKDLDRPSWGYSNWDEFEKAMMERFKRGNPEISVYDMAPLLTNLTTLKLLRYSFYSFNKFKWHYVGEILDSYFKRDPLFIPFTYMKSEKALSPESLTLENSPSAEIALTLENGFSPENALIVIEAELNFMYEFFFTKASILWNKVGCLCHLASFISIVTALLVFVTYKKHDFNESEIQVTYILLFGAVACDIMSLLRLIFSDWSIITCSLEEFCPDGRIIPELANILRANLMKIVIIPFLEFRKSKWSNCQKEPYTRFHSLFTSLLFRKWSGTILGYDFVTYCFDKFEDRKSRLFIKFLKQTLHQIMGYFGAEELVETWMNKKSNPFPEELWRFIFCELQRKSLFAQDQKKVHEICEATGEWVLQEQIGKLEQQTRERLQLQQLMPYVNSDETKSLGDRIMIWHIATGVCYYKESQSDQGYVEVSNVGINHRRCSKLLSDYMMYLLVMEPDVISTAAAITIDKALLNRIVKDADCVEISSFVRKNDGTTFAEFCNTKARHPIDPFIHDDEYPEARHPIDPFIHDDEYPEARHPRDPFIHDDEYPKARHPIDPFIKARHPRDPFNHACQIFIHGCHLAGLLMMLTEKAWEMMAHIWVEMLSYVALNTRPDMHVQQLSKGGQLISLVWVLMLHMGLGGHRFQRDLRPRTNNSEPQKKPPLRRSI